MVLCSSPRWHSAQTKHFMFDECHDRLWEPQARECRASVDIWAQAILVRAILGPHSYQAPARTEASHGVARCNQQVCLSWGRQQPYKQQNRESAEDDPSTCCCAVVRTIVGGVASYAYFLLFSHLLRSPLHCVLISIKHVGLGKVEFGRVYSDGHCGS